MAYAPMKFSDLAGDLMLDALSSATSGGTFTLYTGSPPASPMTPVPPQRLLARLAFDPTPAPAASTGHTLVLSALTRSAEASGRATWGRASNAAGAPLFDMPLEGFDVEADAPVYVAPIEVRHG